MNKKLPITGSNSTESICFFFIKLSKKTQVHEQLHAKRSRKRNSKPRVHAGSDHLRTDACPWDEQRRSRRGLSFQLY